MATTVDLTLGLNLTVGSVPVSLQADINSSPTQTVYTFDGCIQEAAIPLGRFISFVGSQFNVAVALPPELNLAAEIDYLVGQVIYTKPTTGNAKTELGVSGKFDLTVGADKFSLQFYADVMIEDPAPTTGNLYVVGAAIDTELSFVNLPLVGKIPGFQDLTLTNVGFSYTNANPAGNNNQPINFNIPQVSKSSNPLYTGTDPNAKNATNYNISSNGQQRSFNLNAQGFSLTVGLVNKSTGETMSNFALPMSLPSATPPPVPAPANFAPGTTSPPASSVHWIDINKTFGPVDLKQIGLNYSKGEATFGFSAGFALGGFGLDLEGLTITFPLPLPGQPAGKSVSFGLDGLGISIQRGSFEMAGAFLRVIDNNVTSYYGEIAVKVGTFGLKALGGYTPAHNGDPASFFLYAAVQAPLGGPPFLFITGFAGGFGINRTLILPTIDDLPTYILMPSNAPAPQGSPADTINAVLPQFKKYFKDQPGEYWVAAGISFTSFEMINAFALVTVSFGVSFQVGLLGSCSMSFPASGAALAYIEIDIVASFTPASGLLAVDGRLNPASYIYGGFIHLSGGFAFYIWFGATQHTGEDDHKGQFVVSIGGYHPAFDKPLYYPTVPRLAMSAGLGPLQITGQAYFALTPAMMMAGISMTATWSSGPIKAWFSAGVDFLIAWAPFHYEASAYVTIGCSVNLGLFTLNVHVGAALAIWGPEFGGKATVDLDVVSFTISFGAPPSTPPPINWDTFRASFLPPDTTPKQQPQLRAMTRRTARAAVRAPDPLVTVNVIKATVAKGLLGTYDGDNWLIDPDHFVIDTNSSIPSNIGQWTITGGVDTISPNVSSYGKVDADGLFLDLPPSTFSPQQVWNPNLDIGPMDQKGVKSYHTITLLRVDSNTLVTGLSVMPILLNSNAALWTAKNDQKTANDPPLTNSTLVGFEITPIPQHPDQVSNVPLLALLFDPGSSTGFSYQTATVDPNFTVQATTDAQGDLTIAISGAHSESIVNTGNELAALVDPWVAGQRTSLLTDLAASFDTYAPADVSLTMMAQKALMNWPTTELLGADS